MTIALDKRALDYLETLSKEQKEEPASEKESEVQE